MWLLKTGNPLLQVACGHISWLDLLNLEDKTVFFFVFFLSTNVLSRKLAASLKKWMKNRIR